MYITNYNNITTNVTMPQKGIFHIKVAQNGSFHESLLNKYNIVRDTDDSSVYTESANGISDGKYTFTANGTAINFIGSKKNLDITIHAQSEGFRLEIPVTEKERLFGMGDETRESIMKRGRVAVMWQQNVVSYGPIPFLVSSEGWGILVNSTYRHTYDLAKSFSDRIIIECKKGTPDFYIFLADNMKDIISLYTDVSGKPIMLPKFAYGLTFVGNEDEGAREMLENCVSFRREDIPCDVYGLEPNWMSTHYDYSINKTWNKNKFYLPYWKPEGYNGEWSFFFNLRNLGFAFTLWLCCDYDLFWHEEQRDSLDKEELRTVTGAGIMDVHFDGDSVLMDKITVPSEPWFEHLKKFVDQGAAGFKLDGALQVMPHPDRLWAGKYTDDEIHNLYPVVYVKQMKEGYTNHTGKRALIYTPCLYTGTQQYAATWAGDTKGDIQNIPYIINMAFCGHTNASCDVDVTNPEGAHFGFLMPWTQINAWRNWNHPWFLGDESEDTIRYYAKLRSSLFPYLYSMAHYAARTGIAVARPLPLVYEDIAKFDDVLNMYMLGDSLLIGAFDMHLTLPEGRWYDWFTGDIYEGECELDYIVPEGKGGAILVKEGSVFVTQNPRKHITSTKNVGYVVNVFPGADCSFSWIEDDGITYDYVDGCYAATEIMVSESSKDGFVLKVGQRTVFGGKDIELDELTDLTVKILGVDSISSVAVAGNAVEYYHDEQKNICFDIKREQRMSGNVICNILYYGKIKVEKGEQSCIDMQ